MIPGGSLASTSSLTSASLCLPTGSINRESIIAFDRVEL